MLIHVNTVFSVDLIKDSNDKFLEIFSWSEGNFSQRRFLSCKDDFQDIKLLPFDHNLPIQQTKLHF